MDMIKRKATGIELHPKSINREDELSLSRSWKFLPFTS
jgi:hypothetical protein